MAGMKQAQKQTNAQRLFSRLNPASWFHLNKKGIGGSMAVSPEPEMDGLHFGIMRNGLIMDGLMPLRSYSLGREGKARERLDVAAGLAKMANADFERMKENEKKFGVQSPFYEQAHRNAIINLGNAKKLCRDAALLTGNNGAMGADAKLMEIKLSCTSIEIELYHKDALAGKGAQA